MDQECDSPLPPIAGDSDYKPEFVIVFGAVALCGALVGFLVGWLYK